MVSEKWWTLSELIPCKKLNHKVSIVLVAALFAASALWLLYRVLSQYNGGFPGVHHQSWPYTSPSSSLISATMSAQSTDNSSGNPFRMTDADCGRVLADDQEYVKERVKHRRTRVDPGPDQLDLSCEAIHARHPTFAKRHPNSEQRDKFPIAFGRAVFRDYLFLEAELAVHYVPENWYCYAIDKNTDETFRKRMKALAECFPNVVIADEEFGMDRYGHNMWKSLLGCMRVLLDFEWEYVVNLQNGDIQLRTNEEMVQIFKLLNGTNDIQFTHIGAHWVDFEQRNWTLAHLRLFKNESKNQALDAHGHLLQLKKTKGQVECSLSRPFVEWLINDLNPDPFLAQLDSYTTVVLDEVFIPTLAANEFLKAPGGFTRHCYDKALAPSLTRFAFWVYAGSPARQKCRSKMNRHNVCVFGLEDIVPNFMRSPFMFANKVMPDHDADVVQCWHEVMRNRTFGEPGLRRLRAEMYTELPQVRYNELRKRDGHVDLEQFNCTYTFLNQVRDAQEWYD